MPAEVGLISSTPRFALLGSDATRTTIHTTNAFVGPEKGQIQEKNLGDQSSLAIMYSMYMSKILKPSHKVITFKVKSWCISSVLQNAKTPAQPLTLFFARILRTLLTFRISFVDNA